MIFLAVAKKPKRRKRIKRRLLRVLNLFFIVVLGGIVYSLGVTTYENVQVYTDIEAFKARATTEISVTFDYGGGLTQERIYHIVPRETYYELNDARSVFYDETQKYLGNSGDIFATQQSPFPTVPVFHPFMTAYFGGHAAIKSDHNTFYEATGFADSFQEIINTIKQPGDVPNDLQMTANDSSSNYWLNPRYRTETNEAYSVYGTYYRKEFIGLRVKDITEEQLTDLDDFASSLVDTALYNYLFFVDMNNKYYCSDLVSRAYQHVMVSEDEQKNYSTALNDDGFITSVNDLILSNETYIIFYVEIVDDVVNIYHLADI